MYPLLRYEEGDELVEIADILHGPDGCPWDRKQTFQSLRPHILEEVHELLEAVDDDDAEGMVEELGDVLFKLFSTVSLEKKISDFPEISLLLFLKACRRHPHVFGDVEVKNADEVVHHWEKAKAEEEERKHPLEEFQTLGALARTQESFKVIH